MRRLKQLGENLNAYTVSFAVELLEDIRQSYYQYVHPLLSDQPQLLQPKELQEKDLGEYHLVNYPGTTLLWVSSNTAKTYNLYRQFLDKLDIIDDIKLLVDYREKIVMYCGFLVVSNVIRQPKWHYDYRQGANAYTLITPLLALSTNHGNLCYRDDRHKTNIYRYKLGEAIIFGEGFLHSTEPYPPCSDIRVLVSLTCGTDKLGYWHITSRTIATQSRYFVLPCGCVVGTCNCYELFQLRLVRFHIWLFLRYLAPLGDNVLLYIGLTIKNKD
ncbi:MAG: hypothetical protein RMK91_03455 [Pseudanabaenaceae cyanobacterium SKYGB_i_bin29]|nr:hypothetical protein [Pseudanabaenaceae cyanobacterium SKYG29]MDW8420901.1 hypothetical protein [Pseudanabaenaceae cyanobacterium SKYGB_i_bin29]